MRRTELLQEVRKMRFEEAYWGRQKNRLTQSEGVKLLKAINIHQTRKPFKASPSAATTSPQSLPERLKTRREL